MSRQMPPQDSDGSIKLKLRVPPGLWSIIVSYATKLEIDAEVAMRVFMQQLDALIAMGSISWLSPDWQAVIKPQQTTPTIDHARLHRSERTKSGFVGVYANGAGFRAVGRAGAYIGTFQSAEVAAWERYLHYTRAGLPYGELEVAIDELRKHGEQGTDAELQAIVIDTARKTGTLHLYEGGTSAPIQMLGFVESLETASMALERHDGAKR